MYQATSNNGGQIEIFGGFAEAAEWLVGGSDWQTADSDEGQYVYPADSECDDNSDCAGEVVEVYERGGHA